MTRENIPDLLECDLSMYNNWR